MQKQIIDLAERIQRDIRTPRLKGVSGSFDISVEAVLQEALVHERETGREDYLRGEHDYGKSLRQAYNYKK